MLASAAQALKKTGYRKLINIIIPSIIFIANTTLPNNAFANIKKDKNYVNIRPKPSVNYKSIPLDPKYQVSRGFYNFFADYKNYYKWSNLKLIGYGVLGSAIVANSRLDESINRGYQNNLVNNSTNKFAAIVKHPGNNSTILWYIGGSVLGMAVEHLPLGNTFFNWSTRTLRSVLVGAPPVLILQRVLGTSRPNSGSQWRPFHAEHAVSGHAFLGSLPFITAAQMTNNIPLKILFYGGSTLTGWSRLNDNKHYFSQVVLGWWMGYLAVKSVSNSQLQPKWQIMPYSNAHGESGLVASLSF